MKSNPLIVYQKPKKLMANPNYPNRKSFRLKGYDYSKNWLYFITLCCYDRICMFGDIQLEKSVSLNADGNNN